MAIFNDGDPIDASQLTSLQTQINELIAKIPQIGASTTSINLTNTTQTTVTAVVPKIYSGTTSSVTLKPGQTATWTLNYSDAQFESAPVIVISPVHKAGGGNMEAYIVDGTVDKTTAQAKAYLPKDYASFAAKLNFIAISH